MATPNVYFKVVDYSAYASGVEGTRLGIVCQSCWGDESGVNYVTSLDKFVKRFGVFISPDKTPGHLLLLDYFKFGSEVLLVRSAGDSNYGYTYFTYAVDNNRVYLNGVSSVSYGNSYPFIEPSFSSNLNNFLFIRTKHRGTGPINSGAIGVKFIPLVDSLSGEVFCVRFKVLVDVLVYLDNSNNVVLGSTMFREEFVVSLDKNDKDGFGNSIYIEDVINNNSDLIYVKVNSDLGLSGIYLSDDPNYNSFAVLSSVISFDSLVFNDDGSGVANLYDKFKNKSLVPKLDLLVPGYHSASVYNKMAEVCDVRLDCFFIVSPSYSEIVNSLGGSFLEKYVSYFSSLPKNFRGAGYASLIYTYEPSTNKEYLNTCEGYIAGLFALIAYNGDVWDAHAGITNMKVNVEVYDKCLWDEGSANVLYDLGYNFITKSYVLGSYVEGQQTLHGVKSMLKDIPVVLLVNKIYFDLVPSLLPFKYTPNNESTRSFVKSLVDGYLDSILAKGGLNDKKVRCDSSNNPDDGDLSKLNVNVGIKPLNYIYDIYLNLFILPQGISMDII